MELEIFDEEYTMTRNEFMKLRDADRTEPSAERESRQVAAAQHIGNTAVQPKSADTSWMQQANCLGKGRDLFFPKRGESANPPKEICNDCPVKSECLDYSLLQRTTKGIWGGTSEKQRKNIRKKRSGSLAD